MANKESNRIKLLGVPLDNFPEGEFESIILSMTKGVEAKRCIFLDFVGFMQERRRLKNNKSRLQESDLILTTSKTVARAAEILYGAKAVRHYPFSLVVRILGLLEQRGLSVYFLGGNNKELMKIFTNTKASFPSLKIVGRYVGTFSKEEEESVLTGVKKASPAFFFVGNKVKQGDLWLKESIKKISPCLALWSPLAFEVMSGKKKALDKSSWYKSSQARKSSFLPWFWFRCVSYLHFWTMVNREKRKIKKLHGE